MGAPGVVSILVDANLLIYAALPAMAEHEATRGWLEERFADRDGFVGLCWPALYAFVRIVSNRRIMGDDAVGLPVAWEAADAYRRQPTARMLDATPNHHRVAGELILTPGLASNDVADVHLAALAIEHGLILCTHDHGFGRFAPLRWSDPLA